tara:strand:+ start:1056 stop:2633 length:1578 start_codon:yes stop_codon:yes gene_type:complete
MGKGEPDISELAEKAKIVAEATGRDETDVLSDLLDDGIVNMSNENNRKDLVTQLKEAAELITTVQAINKDVSENTVLNGGDNKTEVQIETTLEGDIVDRAIQSIQRKSENIKKLLITMTPLFLLITGGGLEALGVIDVMDGEGEDIYYDDSCFPSWGYDEYGYLEDNNLEVRFTFQDYNTCGIEHFGGHFIITLFESGDETEQVFIHNIDFIDYITMEYTFEDLEGGDYHYRVEFHVVECEDGSCEHGDEYYLPTSNYYYIEALESCDAYFINEQAYLLEDDTEKDAVRISADVALVEGAKNCDGEQFEIIWKLYQDNEVKYEHKTWEDGVVTDTDGADYTFHTWDAVEPGNYNPKAVLILNGDILDEKWIAHSISIEQPIYGCTDSVATNYDSMATDDDGSCEYEPEICEINIFQIDLFTNTTHATVNFDLDCGYEPNDLEGYNVSVQFLIYEVNATANDSPLEYDTALHYIQGFVGDTQVIVLDNFSQNNTTHYDIYWYAIWIDDEGEQKVIEQNWLNREMTE